MSRNRRYEKAPKWYFVVAGAVGVVALLGYSGQLSGVLIIDRALNPDARGYFESADDYVQDIFNSCAIPSADAGAQGAPDSEVRSAFETCYDDTLEEAIDRGYLTEEEIQDNPPSLSGVP